MATAIKHRRELIKMSKRSYDSNTINAANPIARYSHRNRLSRGISLVTSQTGVRKLLDYGCGTGAFINAIQGVNDIVAIGYEPFMTEYKSDNLPIYSNFDDIEKRGLFDIITIFETIEHLDVIETKEFLGRASALLSKNGKILFSAPIEIGPALLMKEFNRGFFNTRFSQNDLIELLVASFFGLASTRAENIKCSHKGFDFRRAIHFLNDEFGTVKVASYGPLPIGTWYGNSQVFFWLTKR
ncbi:MAG: methyltransferase domain-containing protein [Dolichospermum sp.]